MGSIIFFGRFLYIEGKKEIVPNEIPPYLIGRLRFPALWDNNVPDAQAIRSKDINTHSSDVVSLRMKVDNSLTAWVLELPKQGK
ncbi:hypothetical protein FKM82_025275 [Ascaphus truei]